MPVPGLRKTRADDVFRLLEHLPEREALEQLEQAGQVINRRFLPAGIGIFCFWLVIVAADFYVVATRIPWPFEIITGLLILRILPSLSFLIWLRNYKVRRWNLIGKALVRLTGQITCTDALDVLLRFTASLRLKEYQEIKQNCWNVAARLLPRLSPAEAQALSSTTREFLMSLLKGSSTNLRPLKDKETIAVLLVLSAVKDKKMKNLIEKQIAHPTLREAAQSILDDW